ncbi:hypothetical protein D3C73_1316520 [compost metagenome]
MHQRRRQLIGRSGRRHQLGIRLPGNHLRLLIEADQRGLWLADHPFVGATRAVDVGQNVAALGIHGNEDIGLGGACQQHTAEQSRGECFHYSSPLTDPEKWG